MTFCKQCGARISDDSRFCTVCGTKVEPVAVVPQVRGRGLAIASLIVSIVGLAAGFGMLMVAINMSAQPSMLVASLLYFPIPLLATCFAKASRSKGYVYGISKSGLIMGIAGLSMLSLAILILLTGLS